jgi:hypothetical protein
MKQTEPRIYLAETIPTEMGWQVRRWQQHPVLLPRGLVRRTVSTAAGDVAVYLPDEVRRNREVLYQVFAEVQQLHPKPDDLNTLNMLTRTEQLRRALDMALEYVELAEDGRGHNERSHHLARCLRHISNITSNPVGSTADADDLSSDAQAAFDSQGGQDE